MGSSRVFDQRGVCGLGEASRRRCSDRALSLGRGVALPFDRGVAAPLAHDRAAPASERELGAVEHVDRVAAEQLSRETLPAEAGPLRVRFAADLHLHGLLDPVCCRAFLALGVSFASQTG